MRTRPDIALLVLAVVALLADLACVLTGRTAPDLFGNLALMAFSAAAGLSIPAAKAPTANVPSREQTPAALELPATLEREAVLRTYSGPVVP
ncbi:hypothetical protein [Streptomyces sp. NPDC005093]